MGVPDTGDVRPIARLWELAWNDERIACTIYRNDRGFQLRLESATTVLLTESVELQPRTFARTRALRASLKRRGWRDS
jgi:hypothetical protein